jgi:hypothetical protein
VTGGRPVVIEKRKWDGSVSSRWPALLRREGDRVLLFTPAGTRRAHPRRGEEEVTARDEHAASAGRGWIATAVIGDGGEVVRYAVDATVGDERERDGVFAFVDLDIDLAIDGGDVEVRDLGQFAERRRAMGYPDAVMRAALRSIDEARGLHAAGRWPFDGSLGRAGGRNPPARGSLPHRRTRGGAWTSS